MTDADTGPTPRARSLRAVGAAIRAGATRGVPLCGVSSGGG